MQTMLRMSVFRSALPAKLQTRVPMTAELVLGRLHMQTMQPMLAWLNVQQGTHLMPRVIARKLVAHLLAIPRHGTNHGTVFITS
jgi:hypothetical protein